VQGVTDGLNEAYASALLHDYLENPEAVPEEWRAVLAQRSAETLARAAPPVPVPSEPRAEAPPPPAPPAEADTSLLAAVAAATALVDA